MHAFDGTSHLGNSSRLDNHLNANAVAGLSILTAVLSLLGSGSVLALTVYHRCILYPEIFPTFHLAIADVLASMTLIISSIIFLSDTSSTRESILACAITSGLITSFYTSAFFLTLVFTLEALFRFRKRLREGSSFDSLSVVCSRYMDLAYVFSWLCPFILGVVLTYETYTKFQQSQTLRICSLCFPDFRFDEGVCWKGEGTLTVQHLARLIFLIPLVIVMVTNMVLYVLIWRTYRQLVIRSGLLSYHQRQEEKLLRRKICCYQAVFFLCWVPSIVVGFSSFHDSYSASRFYPGLLIQVILGPLQGLLNSVIYGRNRESFRKVLTERSSLLSTNRATMMSVTL